MLGKLIKHEWKGTYRAGCLILLALAAVTFMGWLAFQSPMWSAVSDGDYRRYSRVLPLSGIMDLLSMFTLLFYVMMLAAASIGLLIFLATHFYKTMYSGEGYLTHTLPVTKNKLLVSKILVGGIWVMIVFLAIVVSVAALISFIVATALSGECTVWEFWRELWKEFGGLMRVFALELDMELGVRTVYWIVCLLAGPFVTLCILFGAISLGQLFTRHRVLMAIVCYIGVNVVSGIVQSVLEVLMAGTFLTYDNAGILRGYIDATSITSTIIELVLAALMYLASYLVISKKLNLE